MSKEKINQYKEEVDSWKRVLGFLQAENNYLKIRLAHLVSREVSQKFLAKAENLQNELIQKDELIALNRSALLDFDRWLDGYAENDIETKNVLERRKHILAQVEQLEYKFSRHSAEFNEHLIGNL